jgi:hypothetical protein
MKYRILRPNEILREGDEYMCNLKLYPNGSPREWTNDSCSAGKKCSTWETMIHRRPISTKVGAPRRAVGRKRPVVLDNGRSHEIAGCSSAVPASDNRRSRKAVAKKK